MEDMIQQIIRIDENAYAQKLQREEMILQKEQQFEKTLREVFADIVSEAQMKAKEKYEKEIREQTAQMESMNIRTEKIVQTIKQKYERVQDETCAKLCKQIFSMEE